MSNWWEVGTETLPSTATKAFDAGVSNIGFSSPSVSTSRAWDISDKSNVVSADGLLSGAATISTTTWTTPLLTPGAANKEYRIETDITDGSETITLVMFLKVPY